MCVWNVQPLDDSHKIFAFVVIVRARGIPTHARQQSTNLYAFRDARTHTSMCMALLASINKSIMMTLDKGSDGEWGESESEIVEHLGLCRRNEKFH
jgi:hypothetical protein